MTWRLYTFRRKSRMPAQLLLSRPAVSPTSGQAAAATATPAPELHVLFFRTRLWLALILFLKCRVACQRGGCCSCAAEGAARRAPARGAQVRVSAVYVHGVRGVYVVGYERALVYFAIAPRGAQVRVSVGQAPDWRALFRLYDAICSEPSANHYATHSSAVLSSLSKATKSSR